MVSKTAEPWLYNCLRTLLHAANEHSGGVAAIARGESPDGSGNPLPGGLTLPNAPGAVLFVAAGPVLGTSVASFFWDNTNSYLGVGTATPSARVHANIDTVGTSTIGALGTALVETTVAGVSVLAIKPIYQSSILTEAALATTAGGLNWLDTTFSGTAIRFAFSSTNAFLQSGRLDSGGTVQNKNMTLGGAFAEAGTFLQLNYNKSHFLATGTGAAGRAVVGINSDPSARTGTGAGDQPILAVEANATAQFETALMLMSGYAFSNYSTEGAAAKVELMQVRASTGVANDRAFAIDRWGRLCLYNPGNGVMSSRISGRRGPFLLEGDETGASTPRTIMEVNLSNIFSDGAALGVWQLRIGESTWPKVLVGGTPTAGGNVQPLLLDRFAIRTSAFYASDGSYATGSGEVGAPLGLMNVLNYVTTGKVILALRRMTSQTGNFLSCFDTDNSTVLASIDSAGAALFPGLTINAANITTDTSTGMKIGTATAQKLGFWNTAPNIQPTTAITAATFVANTSAIADDSATFDGYTIGQVVAALRRAGLLA